MSAVEQLSPPSFCVQCDAPTGECLHGGARYHESWFEYQTTPGSGQIRPEFRDWFQENPFGYGPAPEPKARELTAIVSGLSRFFYLEESVHNALASAYEREPLKVSQLTAEIQLGCESGRLKRPTGLLLKLLKELAVPREF